MRKQRISFWSMAISILLALPVVASSGPTHISTAVDFVTDQCFTASTSPDGGTLVETIDLRTGEVVAATTVLLAIDEELIGIELDAVTGELLAHVANSHDVRVTQLDPTNGQLASSDQKGVNQACNYQAIYFCDSAISKLNGYVGRGYISPPNANVLIALLNQARDQARFCLISAAIATLQTFNTTVDNYQHLLILTPPRATELKTIVGKAIGKLMTCSCTAPLVVAPPSERTTR